jgi:hypothetical protein
MVARLGSILLLGLGLVLWPSTSRARQSDKTFHLGWLGSASTQIGQRLAIGRAYSSGGCFVLRVAVACNVMCHGKMQL